MLMWQICIVFQNVIRVCRIRSFCHRLVGVDASEMTYDKVSGKFEGPEEPQLDSTDQLDIEVCPGILHLLLTMLL